MSVETTAINIWLDSVLSVNETLIDLLGEPFHNSTKINRKTNYQTSNALYIPVAETDKVYKVITGGRTGNIEPVFPTDALETVVDGTVIWQQSGNMDLRPRIFEGIAPVTAKEPFIVYNLQTPQTTKRIGMGGTDLFGDYTYQVRGTDRGSDKTTVSLIADTIDDILNIGEGEGGYPITFNSKQYIIMGCYRDIPIDMQEINGENRYVHMGGLYPILVTVNEL